MANRSINQGIDAIQSGNLEEGSRLLRLALEDPNLMGELRAVALMWLAETHPDRGFKSQCYNQALAAAPNYQPAQDALSRILASNLPGSDTGPQAPQGGTPPQGMPPQHPNQWAQGQPNNPNQWAQPPQQNPNQWAQQPGGTPPQGMPPQHPNQWGQQNQQHPGQQWRQQPQQQPNQWTQQNPQPGGTPPQGMPPQHPNQWAQPPQQNPNQWAQPNLQQGTPPQGIPPQHTPPQPMMPQQGQQQPQTITLQGTQRSVGIVDGPNGPGTGFFVTLDGLIATTRFIVGQLEQVTVGLLNGQRLQGTVVRAHPEYDLAFVSVPVRLTALLDMTNTPVLQNNAALIAITHDGRGLPTTRRASRQQYPSHWFPTQIKQLPDAGGNPIIDEHKRLVGMLTHTHSRSSGMFFGLHITKIYECVERYINEQQQWDNRLEYCHHCGYASRAAAYGGFYCEHCGGVLAHATHVTRFPQPNLSNLYGENMHQPCPNCQARSGFDAGKCVRCGYELNTA